jgi:hypothetical protein
MTELFLPFKTSPVIALRLSWAEEDPGSESHGA